MNLFADFDEFDSEWRPRLLALAYNEGFRGADQEDAVQDILLDLFKGDYLEKFDPNLGTIETYIYGHARVRLRGYRERFWKRGQREYTSETIGEPNAPENDRVLDMSAPPERRLEIEDLNNLLTKTYLLLSKEPTTTTKDLSRLFAEIIAQVRADGRVDFQAIARFHGWTRQAISQQARDLRLTKAVQELREAIC